MEALLTTCPVSAAPCRNANNMLDGLKRAFRGLPGRSVLVVLPGQNTLKFSYVVRNYARERALGLVGLGEFPPTENLCHVAFAPKDLAGRCLDLIRCAEEGGDLDAVLRRPLKPRLRFDAEIARARGVLLKEEATSKSVD